jgi:hypothetical protein
MENLKMEGTFKSPALDFNAQTGVFEIKGRSLPENAIEVYEPVFKWLEDYIKSPATSTTINVSLEYFNTSSSKLIFELFRKFEQLKSAGNNVKVNWYYELDDPDLREEGETFADLLKLPIELIGVQEFDFTFR